MMKADQPKMNMAEIYAKNPREFTDEEFEALVISLRESRSKFVLGDTRAGAEIKLTEKQKEVAKLDLDIKL